MEANDDAKLKKKIHVMEKKVWKCSPDVKHKTKEAYIEIKR